MPRFFALFFALLYAAYASPLGFSAMPRCWSAAALARRRQRAIDRGFITPHSGPNRKFVETARPLAGNLRLMARSVELHARHDELSGTPHHYARLATAAAKDFLSKAEQEQAQRTHRLANAAKHALPAASPWADAWSDDDFPALDSRPSLPAGGAPQPTPPPGPPRLCDAGVQTDDLEVLSLPPPLCGAWPGTTADFAQQQDFPHSGLAGLGPDPWDQQQDFQHTAGLPAPFAQQQDFQQQDFQHTGLCGAWPGTTAVVWGDVVANLELQTGELQEAVRILQAQAIASGRAYGDLRGAFGSLAGTLRSSLPEALSGVVDNKLKASFATLHSNFETLLDPLTAKVDALSAEVQSFGPLRARLDELAAAVGELRAGPWVAPEVLPSARPGLSGELQQQSGDRGTQATQRDVFSQVLAAVESEAFIAEFCGLLRATSLAPAALSPPGSRADVSGAAGSSSSSLAWDGGGGDFDFEFDSPSPLRATDRIWEAMVGGYLSHRELCEIAPVSALCDELVAMARGASRTSCPASPSGSSSTSGTTWAPGPRTSSALSADIAARLARA